MIDFAGYTMFVVLMVSNIMTYIIIDMYFNDEL
jgi:hypothetical protein